MELKKEFIGSFIFVKELGREIEVNEENKKRLGKYKHLFKNDSTRKRKRKSVRGNSKGDDNNKQS